ncbi:MAG TPA: hypothetical protein PLO93_05790, partial [Candidatus Omnitrophota bacterium]|nr:hypothetical protein [Candidatus Omnitrophota bacterium]
KTEKLIAWAKAWNMIIAQYREDDLISDDEKSALSYTIANIQENDFLAGNITKDPDLSVVPEDERVRARIQFFVSTLFMKMENMPVWEKMYLFSVVTPLYEEPIMYPFADKTFGEYDAINQKYKSGHTLLTYLIHRHLQQWINFVERLARSGKYSEKDISKLYDLKQNERLEITNEDLITEVRLWVSYRLQPLARTVRGVMNYRQVYTFWAKVNYPTPQSLQQPTAEQYNEEIEKMVDDKFEYIVGHQPYGNLVGKEGDKETMLVQDIHYMLKKYRGMKVAYLGNSDVKTGTPYRGVLLQYRKGPKQQGEKVVQEFEGGRIVEIHCINLSSHFAAGQGKPFNQNNIFKFVRGEIVQMMDMNQDFYLEEAFKAPNLMEEFKKESRLAIAGFPEDVITDVTTPAGQVHAFGDHTFVTLVQRTLNFMGIRYHYGHPDFVRAQSFRQLGLLSAPWVNEDIFGAYKGTMYGEKIINKEILQAAKARETVFIGLVGISDKFGAGAGEQAVSQIVYRHNRSKVVGFSRSFMHYVASIGYYLRKPAIVLQNNLYLLTVVLFGMSLFMTFPDELIFGLLGLILSQAITFTGFFQLVLENRLSKAIRKFLIIFPKAAVSYMSLVYTAFSVGMKKAMKNNGDYVKTGRRPGREHMAPFKPLSAIELFDQDGNPTTETKEEIQGQRIGDASDLYAQINLPGFQWVIIAVFTIAGGIFLWQSPSMIWSL